MKRWWLYYLHFAYPISGYRPISADLQFVIINFKSLSIILRYVHKIAKSDYWLHHIYLSACLSVHPSICMGQVGSQLMHLDEISISPEGKVQVQATKAQRGSRYSNTLSLTSVSGWSMPRPDRFTPGKDSVPIVEEGGCAPGPVWKGAENLAPTGIRSPDHSSRSELLKRLHYPTHVDITVFFENLSTKLKFLSHLTRTRQEQRVLSWRLMQTNNNILTFCWPCTSVYLSHYLTNLMHKICFTISFYFMPLHVSSTCARNM